MEQQIAYRIGEFFGISVAREVSFPLTLLIIALAAFAAFEICYRLVMPAIIWATGKTKTNWDDELLNKEVLTAVSQLMPALIVSWLLPNVFISHATTYIWIKKLTDFYIVWACVHLTNRVIHSLFGAMEKRNGRRINSLKGVFQMVKIIIIGIGVIIGIAILFNRSPLAILTAFGASAAILMLVFKDTILGLVAGVQLTLNKMLHKGDWIICEKAGANGEVIDISLTTVKVRNWDNSVITIPPYTLISDSFQNYQPMRNAGGRRVARSVCIDVNSVRFLSDEEMKRLEEKGLMPHSGASGEKTVNLGLFRRHIKEWLLERRNIIRRKGRTMFVMVRQLQPTPQGIPVELYFFTDKTVWEEYEDLQSDIFDYVYATVPEFGLSIYQQPASSDVRGMLRNACVTLLMLVTAGGASFAGNGDRQPVDYVNTLMGTQSSYELSHGNTYPAIALPWGMNFWTPQTGKMGDGWTYTYTAGKIRGFKQTHQPSPWMNDFGQFSLMPLTLDFPDGATPDLLKTPEILADLFGEDTRASAFSHKAETATPYYYSVYLADHDITTEIAPTERAAIFRISYPTREVAYFVADAFDRGSSVTIDTLNNRITGYSTRNSGGVADGFRNWFVMQFDRPFTFSAVIADSIATGALSATAGHTVGVVGFQTGKGRPVTVRVASSFISEQQALENLKEVSATFDEIKDAGRARWNEMLGRFEINDAPSDKQRTFYSCLYRCLLFPHALHEQTADGRIIHRSPYNGNVEEGRLYGGTGFWDTFRALFPLLNLAYPSQSARMQEGWVNAYKESGFLPEWSSPGHRDCMVGNNSASVVADAYIKGIRGYDAETLWKAVTHGAHSWLEGTASGRLGHQWYDRLGYVPCDVGINENGARTLEYAYDDWCIAQFGKALGKKKKETDPYLRRSQNYRNLFDPSIGLMRGRRKDGSWKTPFNPLKWGDVFTEGNSWHYTWSVFHDPQGLISLMGGKEKFNAKLDSVMTMPPLFDESYYGFVIHEIKEMQIAGMGNYAHGNQPAQHILYLYDHSGRPASTQTHVREVMDKLYTPTPDGYCGDEDNGQTSAWYVFSAMGLYPVCPGSVNYEIGSPLFRDLRLHLENGNTLRLSAPANSDKTRYVKSVTVKDAVDTGRNWLYHDELTRGGEIRFDMTDDPSEVGEWIVRRDTTEYLSRRPAPEKRLFRSEVIENVIDSVCSVLKDEKLARMFANCFPNTLDTTVHFRRDSLGRPDTFVYTGDIPAMWLRDSGGQIWPYVRFAAKDPALREMIAGVILRQLKCIDIDPYANAFNDGPKPDSEWQGDWTRMKPEVYERKWEIDSPCYVIRLAHEYWKRTGDTSVFGNEWLTAVRRILDTFREQQRREGYGSYIFLRETARAFDTLSNGGVGAPVKPVGLIASSFRPSDDATTFQFLVPSNFFAVTSLRKAAEILTEVNGEHGLAGECRALADKVEQALKKYATYEHPEFGTIYAYEVDGFGNRMLMDDANVPSLLSMPYLGDVDIDDPIYRNTRRFVWSDSNPYFFRGKAGEGIGGPHVGYYWIWPMSIMMRAFTSDDDAEIADCIRMLKETDAGTGFMHESFHKDDAGRFTRDWFAWQNSLFGELILNLLEKGKLK